MDKLAKVRAEIERLENYKNESVTSSDTRFGWIHGKTFALTSIRVLLDSMQKEPKKCMYSKDNYTDEDRKVLCEDCEEECKFNKKEEPVSEIDFEQELYKYFGQVKDFTLGMRIAKRFYEIGRIYQKTVSEDLEQAAQRYNEDMSWCWEAPRYPHLEAFKAGANWQKEQMMKKAFSAEIGKQRPDYKCVLNGNFFKYDTGDKVKLIIIKED